MLCAMTLQTPPSKRYTPTTALSKDCAHCGTAFRGMPSELASRKFCSQECAGASRRGKATSQRPQIQCVHCGAAFTVFPSQATNGRRKYCSAKCRNAVNNARLSGGRQGIAHTEESRAKMAAAGKGKSLRERSSQWKGGKYVDSAGYVHVMVDALPSDSQTMARRLTPQKYILEHRLVASVAINRAVLPSEVVHHVNGVKTDNRPENLFVIGRKAHSKEHREMERELHALRVETTRLRSENRDLKLRLSQLSLPGLTTS